MNELIGVPWRCSEGVLPHLPTTRTPATVCLHLVLNHKPPTSQPSPLLTELSLHYRCRGSNQIHGIIIALPLSDFPLHKFCISIVVSLNWNPFSILEIALLTAPHYREASCGSDKKKSHQLRGIHLWHTWTSLQTLKPLVRGSSMKGGVSEWGVASQLLWSARPLSHVIIYNHFKYDIYVTVSIIASLAWK